MAVLHKTSKAWSENNEKYHSHHPCAPLLSERCGAAKSAWGHHSRAGHCPSRPSSMADLAFEGCHTRKPPLGARTSGTQAGDPWGCKPPAGVSVTERCTRYDSVDQARKTLQLHTGAGSHPQRRAYLLSRACLHRRGKRLLSAGERCEGCKVIEEQTREQHGTLTAGNS